MNSALSKKLLVFLVIGLFLVTSIGASMGNVYAQDGNEPVKKSVEVVSPYLTLEHLTYADGTELEGALINGPSEPPAEFEAERQASIMALPREGTLANFPSFSWVFGCSAVSGAMIATYYDRNGKANMYTGPTAGGVMPLTDTSWPTWSDGYTTYPNNPLIASHNGVDGRTTKGSIDDYWIKYGSTDTDPYLAHWTEHTYGTAIGDYMKTSQSRYSSTDGSTWFYTNGASKLQCADMPTYDSGFGWGKVSDFDGTYGRKLFYEARGYTVTDCYAQSTDNNYAGGFSLANFQAEINANRPVFLNLAGHSIVGYGYSGSTIYVRDTWDNNTAHTYTMPWGGSYSGMKLLSVSIVNMSGGAPVVIPTPVAPAGTITVTKPTFKWTKITKATKYEFRLYKGISKTPLWTKPALAADCGATYCTKTPTTALALASYKWQVRAYVSGGWKAWSALKSFTVAAPTSGFNSQFTSDASGWAAVKGTWNVASGYYKSTGVEGSYASVVHVNNYPTMTYTVKAKRTSSTTAGYPSTIFIRGTTTPLAADGSWDDGYLFQWANDAFNVWKIVNGAATNLVAWTSNPAIKTGDWNVIKITAKGSALKLYINSTLLWSGTDSSLTTGKVGIGFYRGTSETTTFLVDYATLTTTVAATPADEKVDESSISHPDWTSMYYAGPVE